MDEPVDIEKFIDIAKPLVKMSMPELKTYVYGILHGMACSLDGLLDFDDQTRVRLKTLPDGFEEYVNITTRSLEHNFAKSVHQIDNIE